MKKFIFLLLSASFLCLLCGCNFGKPADDENISGTSPASETTVSDFSAEVASVTKKTYPAEEIGFSGEDDRDSLEEFILEAAKYESNSNDMVIPLIYDDLDGDGKNELIAIYGWKYDLSDKKNCASGQLWFASEKSAASLSSVGGIYGICLDETDDLIETKNIDGHSIAFIKQKSAGYAGDDYQYSYIYEIKNGTIRELDISGKFGRFTDLGGGNFSAIKFDRDNNSDYSGQTWKNYWFYFESGEFKEYIGEKITKADFIKYSGGKAVLDGISAEGGEVTDILYRKNSVVNVNYTVTENETAYNKFYAFDVSGGDCKKIESVYEDEINNYGVYLPSVLDPKLGLPEEQLALYKLIEEKAAESGDSQNSGEIIYPIFGDFDGDGKNEMIAIYKKPSYSDDVLWSQESGNVWFASGNSAELIAGNGEWLPPRIVTSRGNTFLKMENCAYVTSSYSCYFIIKNSTAKSYDKLNLGQGVYPYGEHGDFTAVHDSYDMNFDLDEDGKITSGTGHTWKTYWYYYLGDTSESYKGVNISREEFLKYDGAKEILDEIDSGEYEIENILKRGNGIINISYFKTYESEDYHSIGCHNKTLKYRNGKVTDITEKSGYDDGGFYDEYSGEEPVPDFEKFSAMIYDTAGGDENSALLDRFYGDSDNDGKNELYAYYGTAENYSLWFADENGAEKSDKPYELITLDGDVILKMPNSTENEENPDGNSFDYYIIRNGKSVKLNTFGVKNMLQTEKGDFSGYITAKDALSDKSEETAKEYWFYYRNGRFNQYSAELINEDELLEYKGARAFIDEISSMGGEIVNIIRRDNGIININYDSHMQNITMHYYLTLRLDDKDKMADITPRNSDGTLNNKGYYLLKI